MEPPLRSLLAIKLPLVLMLKSPLLVTAPPIVVPPLLPVFAIVTAVPEIVPEVLMLLSELMSTVPVDFVVPPSSMLPLLPAPVLKVIWFALRSLLTDKFPFVLTVNVVVAASGPPITVPPVAPALTMRMLEPEILPVVLMVLSEETLTSPVPLMMPLS